jgi:ABC-type uncharacterized transport system permease subunit
VTTDASILSPAAVTPRSRSWKIPGVFGALAVVAILLFVVNVDDGVSRFAISSASDFVVFPTFELPARATGVVVAVLTVAVAAFAALRVAQHRRVPLWVSIVGSLVVLFGFLVWSAAGSTAFVGVPQLLAGMIAASVPLIFGAMGGVISERVGVVNIAIEGQLLGGAFAAAVVASVTGSWFAGVVAAAVAGVLVSFILAAFSIKYLVDQVIVGVVINVLITGLTAFLATQWLATDPALNDPEPLSRIAIPVLSQLPVIGAPLFNQTILVYIMYVAVALISWGLYKTRWGLRLRAVGEHPQAADTVGINVTGTRFWNVSLAGAVAGIGGSFLPLAVSGSFEDEMTGGIGFVALAAVIFGRWDPIRTVFAGLLFGFASNLRNVLAVLESPVPSQFMLMLPYVVTILAVAGFVGASRGPAASGKPYIKG